jgi:hypothetical protein
VFPFREQPHLGKRGTANSTWKDFEASPLHLRVEDFAAYIDASYFNACSSHQRTHIEECARFACLNAFNVRLPIVEKTRVGEQQTKPFIHDVNQQGTTEPMGLGGKLCFQDAFFLRRFAQNCGEDGGDRRDRTDDLKLAKLPLSQLSYVPAR